ARQIQFGLLTAGRRADWRLPEGSRIAKCPRAAISASARAMPRQNRIGESVPRSFMDRCIDTIEWVAAFFVGIVAANIFVAVLLRNLFAVSLPDAFDFGRLLLGILIFWGIAATSYRGGHITVDLVWANVSPRWQRVIDVFATLVLLFVVSVQTYTLF